MQNDTLVTKVRETLLALSDEQNFEVLLGINPILEAELDRWNANAEAEDNSCCGTCATAYLSSTAHSFAYITSQNLDSDTLYIGFGGPESDDEEEQYYASRTAGALVAWYAQSVGGLKVEWENDPEKKVKVML